MMALPLCGKGSLRPAAGQRGSAVLYHVTVLSNFARAFDRYSRGSTLLQGSESQESTFPDRFRFLLGRDEIDIDVAKAARLLDRLRLEGDRLLVLRRRAPAPGRVVRQREDRSRQIRPTSRTFVHGRRPRAHVRAQALPRAVVDRRRYGAIPAVCSTHSSYRARPWCRGRVAVADRAGLPGTLRLLRLARIDLSRTGERPSLRWGRHQPSCARVDAGERSVRSSPAAAIPGSFPSPVAARPWYAPVPNRSPRRSFSSRMVASWLRWRRALVRSHFERSKKPGSRSSSMSRHHPDPALRKCADHVPRRRDRGRAGDRRPRGPSNPTTANHHGPPTKRESIRLNAPRHSCAGP